jgi:acyl dehydratase
MDWKNVYWEDIAEGDELPSATREITRTTIVATAIATRDFTPVHHDHEAAQRDGAKDIFLNILSTGGFVGKYLTDWSGPGGGVKKMTINLGATVFPGDILTSGGKISKKYMEGDAHLVDVDFNLLVEMGPHAWGTATMTLPTKG